MQSDEFKSLVETINYHNWRYFVKSDPQISDAEFDLMCKKRNDALESNPALIKYLSGSPVGYDPIPQFESIKHSVPMLSLQNAFNFEDVADFFARISKIVAEKDFEIVCELKYDGVSFCARYLNGEYVLGLTRGNGEFGEVVTDNIAAVGLPILIDGDVPQNLEVRGEIYVTKEKFRELNEQIVANGGNKFANPRNFASGTLRQIDSNAVKIRGLSYVVYTIAVCDNRQYSQTKALDQLKKWGFCICENFRIAKSAEEAMKYHEDIVRARESLKYEIDGAVYKVNDFAMRQELGSTNKSPRWALAHKFASPYAETSIADVKFQVGKSGAITPIAIVDTVSLGGIAISRICLHNKNEIEKLQLRIGSHVLIERSGDVIPCIKSVTQIGNGKSVEFPRYCPSCGSELVIDGAAVVCQGGFNCEAQAIKCIEHFCSRNAMNIDGFGSKTIAKLWNCNLIRSYASIFQLEKHRETLEAMDGFGKKTTSNMLIAAEKAKSPNLFRFLYALAIPNVGLGVAKSIELHCKKNNINFINDFIFGDESKNLGDVKGLGSAASNSCTKFFEENRDMMRDLLREITIKDV